MSKVCRARKKKTRERKIQIEFKWNGKSLALKYLKSTIFKAATLVAKQIKTRLPAQSSNHNLPGINENHVAQDVNRKLHAYD